MFWLYSFAPLFVALLLGGVIAKVDAGDAALTVRHLFFLKLVVFPYAAFSTFLVFRNLHNIKESPIYARMAMMFCIFCALWLLRSISLGPNLPPPPHPKLVMIPATSVSVLSAREAAAHAECIHNMNEYALAHHTDPQKYIARNQSYLQKCTEYLMNKNEQPETQ